MTRVACIGECMVELRAAGEGLLRRGFAGDAYNTAVFLKRSAPEMVVEFATVTGDDALSGAMRDAWRAEGIGEALAGVEAGGSAGLYMIETDAAGERRFRYWRRGSAARCWARFLADDERLAGADLVYLSGISLAILSPGDRALALRLLSGLKGLIAFDPNHRPALWRSAREARATFEAMVPIADILLPSRQDLAAFYGPADDPAERLIALGAREFAVTSERGGCVVFDGALTSVPPAPPSGPVVDTSGAGDSFDGAYLAARLSGASPFAAARAGLALAAFVVTRPGAIPADLPSTDRGPHA